MLSPSNEDRICAMFDSFCKTVSRNFVRNLDRAEGNRDKHFADEPVDYLLETLGRRDKYPSESFVLYVGGYSCAVESETLYKALVSLPEKQKNVLLLDFWGGLSDRGISERLGGDTAHYLQLAAACIPVRPALRHRAYLA